MERAGLLKRLLDVFRSLMAQTEDHAVDRAGDIWRVLEAATNCGLHPSARFLRGSEDSIAAAMIQDDAVLGVTDDQRAMDVLARKVRAHVELPRVARTVDRLR